MNFYEDLSINMQQADFCEAFYKELAKIEVEQQIERIFSESS